MDKLGLEDLQRFGVPARLEQFTLLGEGKYKVVAYLRKIEGDGEGPPEFKSPSVKFVVPMGTRGDDHVAILVIEPPVPLPSQFASLEAIVRKPLVYSKDGGITLEFLVENPALAPLMNQFKENGVRFKVKKVKDWEKEHDSPRSHPFQLTSRQMRLFQFALQNGYFQIPRKVPTKKIAEYFSISTVATLEHLRKAQRKILTKFFHENENENVGEKGVEK